MSTLVTKERLNADSPKRGDLVDAAWRLFYRDGYHAVGIDTVLAEAGVAKMTLYKHFPSKEDLIAAVLARRSNEVQAALEEEIEAAGRNPTKRLLAVFTSLDKWFHSGDFNGCAFIKAVAEYPDPKSKPHAVAAAHKASLRTRLTQLATELPAKDPATLANQLMLLTEGAIVIAHVQGRLQSATEAGETAKTLIAAARKG